MSKDLLDFDGKADGKQQSGMGFGLNAAKMADELAAHEFFNNLLRLYSAHSNVRGIPFIGDGFKEAQRKAMWGMLKRGENAGLISVERVSSQCAADTDYHHGVGSMQGTLVGLAQDFAGSNNVNFLVPEGSFGSRRSHSAAAPRYIETKLHENFRKIFSKSDDIILEQKKVGDFKIEPKYFIPLLPVVLLNGAEGMGTGHATHIFQYSPEDLRKAIVDVLDGKKLVDHTLTPKWKDFTGKVSKDKETGQVIVVGAFNKVSSTEIRVTELPVGTQSDKYEEILYKLEDKGIIKRFKNASDDTGFEFILNIPRTTAYLENDELIKLLKLESRDSENLTVWNPDGVIEKYESVEKLLVAWIGWRLERFEDRRQAWIAQTKEQITWLDELIRFIKYYLDGDTPSRWKSLKKQQIVDELTTAKFTDVERLMGMPIWSLTLEKIEEVETKLANEKEKLAKLEADTNDKMFRRELKELKL